MEYIDGYFSGAKTEEEKLRFEKRILEDEEFAQEVAFYISANGLIKSQLEDEKKQRFRQLYNEQKDEHKIVPMQQRTKRMSTRYLAAASVTVAIILLSWLFLSNYKNSAPQLADNYIEQLQAGVTMAAKVDSAGTALNLYSEKKYTEALPIFEALIKNRTADEKVKEYAGLTYIKLERYEDALRLFSEWETKVAFTNPAKLYKAITLMKRNDKGDVGEAKKLLKEISDKDLDGKATAEEWLKKLD